MNSEIKGKTRTEAQYRALKENSSSSLKEFSQDRKKYYKKYILNEKDVEEEDSKASITGRVVETLLMEPDEFEGRFYMSSCAKSPTGLMSAFVEALYKRTLAATDSESGIVTKEFEELCKEAYADSGFKITFAKVVEKFVGSDAEIYYKEIREVRSKGLTVVTIDEINNAEKIIEELRTNPVTAEIVNLKDSDDKISVINQMQISNYQIDGMILKSMLDKVIIYHNKKKIIPYDLKCTWSVENFYEEYYLYRRAYIQGYLYREALKSLTLDVNSPYYGYSVDPLQFIVCDSINYMNPLIYTLDESDMKDAYFGFEHKGRQYPGVKQIISDLKWAAENDKWNISRKNFLKGGILNVKA